MVEFTFIFAITASQLPGGTAAIVTAVGDKNLQAPKVEKNKHVILASCFGL